MASLLSAQNTPVIDQYLCPWISVFTVIHTFICKWNSQVLKEKDHVVVGCCLFVACVCAAEHISLLLRTPQWLSTGAGLKVTSGAAQPPSARFLASAVDVPWLGSCSPCPHLHDWGFLPTLMPGSETCLTHTLPRATMGECSPGHLGNVPISGIVPSGDSFKLMFVFSSKH